MQMELHWEDSQSLLTQVRSLEAVVLEQKKEIAKWRNRARCTRSELKSIRKHGKTKVVFILGDTSSSSYKSGYRLMFSQLWSGYKKYFSLGSIDDTLEFDYTKAIHWINDWRPRDAIGQQLTLGDAGDQIR